VNQPYVIATSTKVDISGVKVDKFDDKYFARDKKQKAKKTEGELFETEKEVNVLYNLKTSDHCIF
jgi:large subunit ribosomal protein L6e